MSPVDHHALMEPCLSTANGPRQAHRDDRLGVWSRKKLADIVTRLILVVEMKVPSWFELRSGRHVRVGGCYRPLCPDGVHCWTQLVMERIRGHGHDD